LKLATPRLSASNIAEKDMSIPGIKEIDHLGFTVPDLDEAVSFFRDHFGFETAYEFGPFASKRIGGKSGWQFKASCQP